MRSRRLPRPESVHLFPALCSVRSPSNSKTIPVEVFTPWKWANTTNQSFGVGGISSPRRWFTRTPLDVWMETGFGMRGSKGGSEMVRKGIVGRRDCSAKTLTWG